MQKFFFGVVLVKLDDFDSQQSSTIIKIERWQFGLVKQTKMCLLCSSTNTPLHGQTMIFLEIKCFGLLQPFVYL
jgi:hypothetical protein